MIKSDVYYSTKTNQLILMTPVYVEQHFEYEIGFGTHFKVTPNPNYQLVGLACDNNELILVLHPNAVKYFEYIGEL